MKKNQKNSRTVTLLFTNAISFHCKLLFFEYLQKIRFSKTNITYRMFKKISAYVYAKF